MAAFLLQEGVFTPVSDNLTVYIRSRDPDGTLRGILVDDARQKDSHATILAERGRMVSGPDRPARAAASTAAAQEIDRKTGRLDVLTFAENSIDLDPAARATSSAIATRRRCRSPSCCTPIRARSAARDVGKFAVEAHRRLTAPLTAVSFALIALVGRAERRVPPAWRDAAAAGGRRRRGGAARRRARDPEPRGARHGADPADLGRRRCCPALIAAWLLFGPQLGAAGPARAGPAARRPERCGSPSPPRCRSTSTRQFPRRPCWPCSPRSPASSSLFDFIELLRRAATKPDVGFGLVLEIAALRLPYVAMEILPFAVLLGGILAFWRLTRSSELIVARAAGVSAWQFLAAPGRLRGAARRVRDRRRSARSPR